ncbi:MAG: hypothetical protein JXR36_02845 [Bacteroidales bacterium]|nr:hypothetical protein [Bacteroidales bacterium]
MRIYLVIIVFFLSGISYLGKAQCGNYQYHILESVSNLYEVSDNTYESFILIRSAFESEDFTEMKLYIDSANTYLDLFRTAAYNSKTSIELAYNDAEMCYCLNGQKKTGDVIDMVDQIYDISKEIRKIVKKNAKATDMEISKRYVYQIKSLLESVQIICDKASEECINAQEACY